MCLNVKKLFNLILECIRDKGKKGEPIKPGKEIEEPHDYIYLSQLKNYLEKYNLDFSDESSFSKYREALFNEGKEYAKNEFKTILLKNLSYSKKAELLCDKYNEIKDRKPKIDFKLAPETENKNSPKIHYTAVNKYLKDMNLIEKAKKDFKDALPHVLQKIYEEGSETVLGEIEVNIEYLRKMDAGDKKNIKLEIKRLEDKLKKC